MLSKENLFAIAEVIKPIDEEMAKIEKRAAELDGPFQSQVEQAIRMLEERRESLRQMIGERFAVKEQQEENQARGFASENNPKEYPAPPEKTTEKDPPEKDPSS